MQKENKLLIIGLFLILVLVMSGCGPTAEEMAATMIVETEAAASPTPTETLEPTATYTAVPTETPEPTETPVPTKTAVPTDTPVPTDEPTATQESSSSSGGFSSGCTGGGCHKFKVNNKTGQPGSITLWGAQDNYYFYVPTGNGMLFSIYPGLYTYRLEYCGNVYTGSHTLNSNWFIDMKCP